MSITTLEDAQKLAKRRDLHLLRLNQTDAKTGRLMFKLVTAADMLADDTVEGKDASSKSAAEKGSKKTTEKSLTIGARITDHDLASRLKNIAKWLHKRHEVRILIQGNLSGADEGSAERIVKTIETTIKEPQVIGKIVQRRQKGGYIKFSIMPMASPTPTPAAPTPAES
ncbi:GH22807 [Drosophila grimshawi]|uniref:GH22807 n=2 Tax=Drosophila grimshawi TaxID=7222 RepID=B4JW55_DROGR|nr:GH22807 [Drosophila grimshawi]